MSDSEIREYSVSDGRTLRFRHWRCAQPAAIVIALHGIQSHSGWYTYSSRFLADAGMDVVFADRRGSGLNGFDRGHASHGLRLIHDVRALSELVRHEARERGHGELPVILMGVSWGGKTAAAAAALFPREYAALILMYPGLMPQLQLSWWQAQRLKLARRWDILKRHIPIPLDNPELFTDSPEWQKFIADDPLTLHTVTSGLLNAGRDLDGIIEQHHQQLHLPTLLMLAGRDRIINNAATLSLVQRFPSTMLSTITYPEACHTLEFHSDRDRVMHDLVAWIKWAIVGRSSGDAKPVVDSPATVRIASQLNDDPARHAG